MDDEIFLSVMKNVFLITFTLMSVYPVVYIVRSMIDFASRAFSNIDTRMMFGLKNSDISVHHKSKMGKELRR